MDDQLYIGAFRCVFYATVIYNNPFISALYNELALLR